jgi:hypothetical protein
MVVANLNVASYAETGLQKSTLCYDRSNQQLTLTASNDYMNMKGNWECINGSGCDVFNLHC